MERQVEEEIILAGSRRKTILSDLWQDIRYGLRMLCRTPGFTAVALMALALGIGANTAIFSVVNALLLRPLPFPQSRQLVVVHGRTPQLPRTGISYPDLEDFRRQAQSFQGLSAWMDQSVSLTGVERPERVRGAFVSANFFDLLGVTPALGRGFLRGEDEPGADRVVLVNYSLWQSRFGGDPNFVGKHLTLNGAVFSVIGILPEAFEFPLDTDDAKVWIPESYDPSFSRNRAQKNLIAVGRMKPGVTLAETRAEMNTLAQRLAQAYPEADGQSSLVVRRLQEVSVESMRPLILVLFAAVGFVLLIACANVVNLLLGRMASRGKEIALRAALGANRWRLVRQMLTEVAVLWLGGGALGLVVGYYGLRLLVATAPMEMPPGIVVGLDKSVLGFTCLVAVLSGLLSGLGPALHSSCPDLNESLKKGGRTSGEAAGHARARRFLLVAQVALSLILLVGAGLMIRTLKRLSGVDPGFQTKNLLTLEYSLPRTKYPEGPQQWNFHRQVVEHVTALPGVQSAAVVLGVPFSGNYLDDPLVLLDRPEPPPGQEPAGYTEIADGHYFKTMGIPLLEGRTFSEYDDASAPRVAIINQIMAHRYWPGGNPIGKQIRLLHEHQPATIVGVVGNVKITDLSDPMSAQVYFAYAQHPHPFGSLVVRTNFEPMSLANAVRQAVWSVDKDQPMWKVRSLESMMAKSVGDRRYLALLLSAYAALALLLAAIGIYGVLSYSVNQRYQEIGVRVALGAQPRDVLHLVICDGMRLALAGLVLGLVGALGLTRLMIRLLFGVGPTDPITIIGVSIVVAAAAFVASYVPARRATKVYPMVALRCE